MDKKTVELLFSYNNQVNQTINAILRKLSEEQWDSQFRGYYKSVRDLCDHLALTDYSWLIRFLNLKAFTYSESAVMSLNKDQLTAEVPTLPGYIKVREELDECFMKLAEELSARDLTLKLKFKRLNGEIMAKPVDEILLHLSHHQTHHRGMLALYFDMLNIENDFSNLLNYF